MMTVLLVTSDDALQRRFEATLEDVSLFVAATDVEAIRQLRMVDIDIVVRPVNGRASAFSGFAEKARSASPRTILVAVVVDQDEAEDADFVLRHDVHDRELKATLRHLFDRRNLARELDRVRLRSRDSESEPARPEEPRDSMKLV